MKIRTKATAEAVLRELPSVLGAFVKEDVHGGPREVHVLIRPGPDAAHLSRDIRELLEERLGVPVDQRVISIAQIEPATGDADSTGASVDPDAENGHERAEGEDRRGGPDSEEQNDRNGTDERRDRSTAEEPHRPAGDNPTTERMRLVYAGLESERRENRIEVRVRLTRGTDEYVGTAAALDTDLGRLRAAAAATAGALTRACHERIRFELESAAAIDAFNRGYAHVAVIAMSPTLVGRRPLTLAGAHPLAEESDEVAAVLATLKATNRITQRGLRAADDAAEKDASAQPDPDGASSERSEI